eukprot:8544305-Lingulodinium_polyedra.AAC.1
MPISAARHGHALRRQSLQGGPVSPGLSCCRRIGKTNVERPFPAMPGVCVSRAGISLYLARQPRA